MILYRCGKERLGGVIFPSNWTTNSIALEFFIDQCEERMIDCGDKIFVIEIPAPKKELVGNYFSIQGRRVPSEVTLPFGNDGRGWWSFNSSYAGPFRIVGILQVKDFTLEEIDNLDARYKPANKEER